ASESGARFGSGVNTLLRRKATRRTIAPAQSVEAAIESERMVKVELGVPSSKAGPSLVRRAAAAAALLAVALGVSACGIFDQFNPFGAEKYKMEVVPDTPASKTYDQGLEKLANGAPKEAAKKFTELGKRYPESDWKRKGDLMTVYAN